MARGSQAAREGRLGNSLRRYGALMNELIAGESSLLWRGIDSRVGRLRRITGFITVYGEKDDPRLAVFARLWHVERVALAARMMCAITGAEEVERVQRLVWLHDLNRWPFAHNAERGNFNQAANVANYFADDHGLDQRDVRDLRAIHEKAASALSREGRTVLLADALTGAIEDILFAVTGLNLHPRAIPGDVEERLELSLCESQWYGLCEGMARKFHGTGEPRVAEYQEDFRYVFGALLKEFLDRHSASGLTSDSTRLLGLTRYVRERFIAPVVFPLNNEKVCHSSWIRNEVVPWYLRHVENARQRLLQIDEYEFVSDVLARNSPFEASQFVADIEYVSRETPESAFVS
ncbi:HD domain-containing protein [Streptomyces longisporoflavus]|uniref:HD domain-containing protein n=1 Tax=Streptomyces longisporoflavus TaxID=28044 RepID=UPI00167C47B2|nr:HD domain-containing protein [Streptomyces longisporoflavus]